MDSILLGMWAIFIIGLLLVLACLCSPFKYPYFDYVFDVSRKRSPAIEDYLNEFLRDGGFEKIQTHAEVIAAWKADCEGRIARSFISDFRKKQYLRALDDGQAYRFHFSRSQTRYRQQNYVRTPYKVDMVVGSWLYSYQQLEALHQRLSEMPVVAKSSGPYAEFKRRQRALMTNKMRYSILQRDGFKCVLCGRRAAEDGVALEVDHIVPVSKGGLTVESNLRTLCFDCNRGKSDRYVPGEVN